MGQKNKDQFEAKEIAKKETFDNYVLDKFKNIEIHADIKSLTGILEGKYPPGTTYDDMRWEYFKDRYGL